MGTAGTAVVIIGGGPISPPPGTHDVIIAADSGLDAARAVGLDPTVLVGDLDSISAEGLAWAQQTGIEISRHPTDKDCTDTDLALDRALSSGARSLALCGPDSTDRIDHLIGALIALGKPDLAAIDHISARLGETDLHVLHPGHQVVLKLERDEVFSLLALHGQCTGIEVSGARWPLADASLLPAETRGISNEACGGPVTISVTSGVLTVIVPRARP
jgi:thiamine pyrophosphokinase